MRRIIAALFVAAGLVSVSSASNNVINQKNTIYHPGQTFSKTFPYAIGDKVSIFSQADSSVQICAAGVLGCNKVNIPDEVQTSKHHISGPFVSSSTPSWLAIGDDASYLCAVSARQSGASCVKLGEFNGKEVDVTALVQIAE